MSDFEVKDSGERTDYASGMHRDTDDGKPRFDLLHPVGQPYAEQFLTRCAVHLAKGAKKYEPRNWEKAEGSEELERFKASAERHLQQWLAGERDEDHAAAVFFNLLGAEFVRWKVEKAAERDDFYRCRWLAGLDPQFRLLGESYVFPHPATVSMAGHFYCGPSGPLRPGVKMTHKPAGSDEEMPFESFLGPDAEGLIGDDEPQ